MSKETKKKAKKVKVVKTDPQVIVDEVEFVNDTVNQAADTRYLEKSEDTSVAEEPAVEETPVMTRGETTTFTPVDELPYLPAPLVTGNPYRPGITALGNGTYLGNTKVEVNPKNYKPQETEVEIKPTRVLDRGYHFTKGSPSIDSQLFDGFQAVENNLHDRKLLGDSRLRVYNAIMRGMANPDVDFTEFVNNVLDRLYQDTNGIWSSSRCLEGIWHVKGLTSNLSGEITMVFQLLTELANPKTRGRVISELNWENVFVKIRSPKRDIIIQRFREMFPSIG